MMSRPGKYTISQYLCFSSDQKKKPQTPKKDDDTKKTTEELKRVIHHLGKVIEGTTQPPS